MNKFAADVERYKSKGHRGKELWLNGAVWSLGCYRLGNWLHVTRPFILIRIPLKVISFVANKFCEIVMEMCIDPHASIGPGLYIGHIGGVHINPQAILGSNCDIAHRVTIGTSAMGRQGRLSWATMSISAPVRLWSAKSRLAMVPRSQRILL